jgi:hypothetical protein
VWGYPQEAAGGKGLFSLENVTGHFFILQRTQSPSSGYLCSRRLRMRYVDESSRRTDVIKDFPIAVTAVVVDDRIGIKRLDRNAEASSG